MIKVGTYVKFWDDMSKSKITQDSWSEFQGKIGKVTKIIYEGTHFYIEIDGVQKGHCGDTAFEKILTKEEYPEYFL